MATKKRRGKCPHCNKYGLVKLQYGVRRYQCEECGRFSTRQKR